MSTEVNNHFDLIVIGGGINGAGIARDAALRGLKVLIVDQGDFASGTSSKSTKLVHGGIRYLENYEFKLVWEACHERKILTQIAPHLVTPVPFVIPVYQGDKRPLWLIRLGMFLYDLMAGFKNIHRHESIDNQKIKSLLPGILSDNLKGGGIYWDCETNDSRLTLENILDAVRNGAVAKNYCLAEKIESLNTNADGEPKGFKIHCFDKLSGHQTEFTGAVVINATGPWLDLNLKKWELVANNSKSSRRANTSSIDNNLLRLTKGIHFYVPLINHDYALLISAKKDGRIFFIIPHGEYSLIGTTDTEFKGDPSKVQASAGDIEYLINEVNRLFPKANITKESITGIYAGLRPLLNTSAKNEGKITREYKLLKTSSASGTIFTIVGGKLTTYRKLSQKITDKIIDIFHKQKRSFSSCNTAVTPLPGSWYPARSKQEFIDNELIRYPNICSLPSFVRENLLKTYGRRVLELEPYLGKQFHEKNPHFPKANTLIFKNFPVIWAQLYLGIEKEFVKTPEDFINRRTDLYINLSENNEVFSEIDKIIKNSLT